MSKPHRKFSARFKAEAVQLVIESGRPVVEIAGDLQINAGTLGRWVAKWRQENPVPDEGLSPIERVRVDEMEDEIRRLRMENEFLKKAAASRRRNRSRALRVDPGGEGELPGGVDVRAARHLDECVRGGTGFRCPQHGRGGPGRHFSDRGTQAALAFRVAGGSRVVPLAAKFLHFAEQGLCFSAIVGVISQPLGRPAASRGRQ